jgi:hypothetical protein
MSLARHTSYVLEVPSKRKPTIDTHSNTADNLERLLQKDGFESWGFVVYRCTYASDTDWERFMSLLLDQVKASLERSGGIDLLDGFAPTVIADLSFEGATTATLRAHFQDWAGTALQELGRPRDYHAYCGRYRFFVMADQEVLESVLNSPPESWTSFVKLVYADWEPEVLDEDEIEALGGRSEKWEPIEGCTLEDVGWMKVPYREVMFGGYVFMCDWNNWDLVYSRPPAVQSLLS